MLSKIVRQSIAAITNIKGKEDYLKQAKESKNYILNFSAGWCGPCKALAPVISQKEKDAQGKWKLLKVDIDEETNQDLNAEFQVQAVPTMIFFKDGKEVHRAVGGMSSQNLDEAIKKIQ